MVDMAGKMNRAFAVNGIPSSRVCTAKKLNFQSHARGSCVDIKPNDLFGGFPRGPAGGPPADDDAVNLAVNDLDVQLRCPEFFFIITQTARPGKTTSCGWRQDMLAMVLFTGSHHRDFLVGTNAGQVIGQIRVLQKIENQIRINVLGEVLAGIIDDRRQVIFDRKNAYFELVAAILSNAGNLCFTIVVLLKDDNFHGYI